MIKFNTNSNFVIILFALIAQFSSAGFAIPEIIEAQTVRNPNFLQTISAPEKIEYTIDPFLEDEDKEDYSIVDSIEEDIANSEDKIKEENTLSLPKI